MIQLCPKCGSEGFAVATMGFIGIGPDKNRAICGCGWNGTVNEIINTEKESMEKPKLTGLVRDDPKTPEGKYLVKRRDGTVVEWPHFVLGARDPHAPAALRAYAESISNDPDCDQRMAVRLFELAHEFDAYRAEHGNGDPTRGIHRKDDPATIAEMKKSKSA